MKTAIVTFFVIGCLFQIVARWYDHRQSTNPDDWSGMFLSFIALGSWFVSLALLLAYALYRLLLV